MFYKYIVVINVYFEDIFVGQAKFIWGKKIMKDSLSKKSKINSIDKDCEELHITKAFSTKDFKKILTYCRRLKLITMSSSTKDRLCEKTKEFLGSKKVRLAIKKDQGRAIEIPAAKLNKILNMYRDYSYRELEEKLGVPKSTIHYLIKKAKKKKIKDSGKIIYLK